MKFKDHRNRWGPEWKESTPFSGYHHKIGGHEIELVVPDKEWRIESMKRSKIKYKKIYDKIKELVKDDETIKKDDQNLPIVHFNQYILLILAAFEELNMKWTKQDKIWFSNIKDDKTPYIAAFPKNAIGKGVSFQTLKKNDSKKESKKEPESVMQFEPKAEPIVESREKRGSPDSSIDSTSTLNLDDLSIGSTIGSSSSDEYFPMTEAQWKVLEKDDKKEKRREFEKDYRDGEIIDSLNKEYFVNKNENPEEWNRIFKKDFPGYRNKLKEEFENYGPVISTDVGHRKDKNGKYIIDDERYKTLDEYIEKDDPINLIIDKDKYFEEVYYPELTYKIKKPKKGFISPIQGNYDSMPNIPGKILEVAEWDDTTETSCSNYNRYSSDTWKMKFMPPTSHDYGDICSCGFTGYEPGFWRDDNNKGLVWKDSEGNLYMKKKYFVPKFMGKTCDPSDKPDKNRLNEKGFDEQVAETLNIKFVDEFTHVMNYSTKEHKKPYYTSLSTGETSFNVPRNATVLGKSRKLNGKYYVFNTVDGSSTNISDESNIDPNIKSLIKGGRITKKRKYKKYNKTRKTKIIKKH